MLVIGFIGHSQNKFNPFPQTLQNAMVAHQGGTQQFFKINNKNNLPSLPVQRKLSYAAEAQEHAQ